MSQGSPIPQCLEDDFVGPSLDLEPSSRGLLPAVCDVKQVKKTINIVLELVIVTKGRATTLAAVAVLITNSTSTTLVLLRLRLRLLLLLVVVVVVVVVL